MTYRYLPTAGQIDTFFDRPMRTSFLLTGHGSMNVYLHKHVRLETQECMCGWEREDWAHILASCVLYHDLRNLRNMGVTVDGEEVDVSRVLVSNEHYVELTKFADAAFRRRHELMAME